MVRAPCCERLGLKKGPWTPEEDEILAAYITRCGHGNWRALPKQAGLLRCGKSCRLRWTNYLRPDIKRGDYSKEEEETIINLHEMLGNRWSIIASRLPGRTDNEIKNVWHTHLKKRLNPNHVVHEPKRTKTKTKPITLELDPNQRFENPGFANVSPLRSYTEASSSGTDSSAATEENSNVYAEVKETINPFEEISDIDDNFWSDVLSMDNCVAPMDFTTSESFPCSEINDPLSSSGSSDDVMDFWLRIFMQTGDPKELPGI